MERVSVTDSFFDLGGSTITAAHIVMFAMTRGYPIVYKDIFAHPSARELARVVAGDTEERRYTDVEDYDYTAINKLITENLSLVACRNKEGENLVQVEADCRFTTNALFRLGFRWPIIDDAYLEKAIWALDTLGFFSDGI